mmetsp:Transcript_30590/g.51707  ORF Transcript_30590/g.51707 Transcript_30590/m.51707 type:complete len:219 (+) Transcript_30590:147-803(+)
MIRRGRRPPRTAALQGAAGTRLYGQPGGACGHVRRAPAPEVQEHLAQHDVGHGLPLHAMDHPPGIQGAAGAVGPGHGVVEGFRVVVGVLRADGAGHGVLRVKHHRPGHHGLVHDLHAPLGPRRAVLGHEGLHSVIQDVRGVGDVGVPEEPVVTEVALRPSVVELEDRVADEHEAIPLRVQLQDAEDQLQVAQGVNLRKEQVNPFAHQLRQAREGRVIV